MGLSAREQQALGSIEDRLAGSAPGLASLLGMFTRLTAGEALPGREMIPAGRERAACLPRGGSRRRIPRPRGRLAWQLLLCIGVSIALIVVALMAGHGGGAACGGVPPPACAGQGHATAGVTAG